MTHETDEKELTKEGGWITTTKKNNKKKKQNHRLFFSTQQQMNSKLPQQNLKKKNMDMLYTTHIALNNNQIEINVEERLNIQQIEETLNKMLFQLLS